jgi:hypothetical protein
MHTFQGRGVLAMLACMLWLSCGAMAPLASPADDAINECNICAAHSQVCILGSAEDGTIKAYHCCDGTPCPGTAGTSGACCHGAEVCASAGKCGDTCPEGTKLCRSDVARSLAINGRNLYKKRRTHVSRIALSL